MLHWALFLVVCLGDTPPVSSSLVASVPVLPAPAAASPSTVTPIAVETRTLTSTVDLLRAEVRTGSLLISEGDCLAVKSFTCSPYTHVAIVVLRRGEPFVYDSTSGAGVRCQTLENYLKWIGEHPVRAYHPTRELAESPRDQLERHLDRQLGRPYAVTHHLTGNRCDGLHCAEYITDALMQAHLIQAKQPPRVSPASLLQGLTQHGLYAPGSALTISPPAKPAAAPGTSWCGQCWQDTKSCCSWTCKKLSSILLCR